MPPQPRLAIVATVQQAITSLLTTYEPEFLRFGFSLFMAFATILIVWQGIKMMLSQDSLGDHLFDFAKLLRRPAAEHKVNVSTDSFANAPLKIREVLFVDTADFRAFFGAGFFTPMVSRSGTLRLYSSSAIQTCRGLQRPT